MCRAVHLLNKCLREEHRFMKQRIKEALLVCCCLILVSALAWSGPAQQVETPGWQGERLWW